MKSPFNWVGNKYKFIDQINEKVKNKKYDMVVDLFMGSGNIILNLECESRLWIGNDYQRLIPMVFSRMMGEPLFGKDEIDSILLANGRFSTKESYYNFREHWNKKYLANAFDRDFILETALLLKMCSNSMVRFNGDGVFNQGFRGLGNDTEFFKQSMLDGVLEQINLLLVYLKGKKFKFISKNFTEYKEQESSNRLLILDPPYSLGDKGVYNIDFSKEKSDQLLNLISNTKNDFIYFNYLEHGDFEFSELKQLIKEKNFNVQDIGDNNVSAGQGGKIKKYVKEVMVSNV
jgi:site-specific DNA-adenine methylase